MDKLVKEYVTGFFDTTLSMFGDRPEALRWNKNGQTLHYESIASVLPETPASVLDYGCGKGDFYAFLKDREFKGHYAGFDINEKLIAFAKDKYPGVDFRVFDVEDEDLEESFDYVLLCGVFNLKVEGVDNTIKNVLKKLFFRTNKVLAYTGLSAYSSHKSYELNYTSPELLLSFALKELSPSVVVSHGRDVPQALSLFVYK
ncbi:MAG: class I SAM-dependent methyltransferase [Nitrospirae bacterium YQR-1]